MRQPTQMPMAQPNMMGAQRNPKVSSILGNNLGAVVNNLMSKIYSVIINLQKNGVLLYIGLIFVGIVIHQVLLLFIGIKVGRDEKAEKARKQALLES